MTVTAPDTDLARRIDELDAKLDRLTELMERDAASKAVVGDLMSDSAPIVRSAYERVAATLHERDIDVSELADLILRFAEAAPDLNRALATFQSLSSLVDDVGGLSGEAFERLASGLDELDRRGYFAWINGGVDVIDRIITGFDEEDMQALGDNVVLIFETVKEMTQPEVMRMLQRSARMMREDVEPPKKLTMFRLLRELRDPEVKLAIYRTLTMLKGIGSREEADETEATEQTELTEHSAKEE
jgi:uncharacterized protein YjgD (DUF1641 family)